MEMQRLSITAQSKDAGEGTRLNIWNQEVKASLLPDADLKLLCVSQSRSALLVVNAIIALFPIWFT